MRCTTSRLLSLQVSSRLACRKWMNFIILIKVLGYRTDWRFTRAVPSKNNYPLIIPYKGF